MTSLFQTLKPSAKIMRCLAPMAGVTNFSFRRIIRKLHSEVLIYSEFTHTSKIKQQINKRLFFESADRPFVFQIFGNDPQEFEKIIPYLGNLGAEMIDINMGCPQKKIANSMHGSGLMKEPELALRIIETCVKNTDTPISVKTRVGWEDAENLCNFAKKLEDAGVRQIVIHGRTYRMKFKGKADWNPIYELKKYLKIPVIGNGDVIDENDGILRVKNLDGYMIGRNAIGNPWVFYPQEITNRISSKEKAETICEHLELCLRFLEEGRAMQEFRKHLKKYSEHFGNSAKIFPQLIRYKNSETLIKEILLLAEKN